MMHNRLASFAGLTLATLVAVAACNSDDLTDPDAGGTLFLGAAGTFSSWSAPLSIEQATPGANAEFNTASVEGCPFISADGKSFYIASNRSGGKGGLDIWVSTRASVNDAWGAPVNAGDAVNSSADDFCPTIAPDLRTFYFVSRRQIGTQGTDWCGAGDIYVARRRDDGTFESVRNLGCQVNSSADEFSPFPIEESGSGLMLYFSSTRPGLGTGGDLYRSLSRNGAFGAAELVPGVNGATDDGQPNIRRDGLELYFYSNRDVAGAQGGNDLYVATRASTQDPWSAPVNLGPTVNSSGSETRPSISWDGTALYFGSNRTGNEGNGDIYVTTRTRLAGR